jgi:formylglycine-generating enzyme required for sulfatase activity
LHFNGYYMVIQSGPTHGEQNEGLAMTHDVFISYSHMDLEIAKKVCATLEEAGLRCWIAPRDIRAGKEWAEAIMDGIETSRAMVLVLSSHANQSQQVRREVQLAVGQNMPVIPFRIENTPPSQALKYFLGAVHWLNAFPPPVEAHFPELIESVKSALPRGASPVVGLDPQAVVVQMPIHGGSPAAESPRPTTPPRELPRAVPFVTAAEPRPQTSPSPLRGTVATSKPWMRWRVGIITVGVVALWLTFIVWHWKAALSPENSPNNAPHVETPRLGASAPAAGTVRQNGRDGLNYVWIPAGTFMMGCSPGDTECDPDEKPPHQGTLTRGFWMGQAEVTVAAYKRFATAAGRTMPAAPNFNSGWANDNMPIVYVTWADAQTYCGWVGGRLPTEAEWEYAARGGSTEARYGGITEVAWYDQNSGGQTHEVAQKRANGFGLYDTLGNVWEWVNDRFDENYYRSSPSQDPSGPTSGPYRVLRGGSWNIYPRGVRVSDRGRNTPEDRGNDVSGFRCVGEVNFP